MENSHGFQWLVLAGVILYLCCSNHDHPDLVTRSSYDDLQYRVRMVEERSATTRRDLDALTRRVPPIERHVIPLGKTGAEVCGALGGVCYAVTASGSADEYLRDCGYAVPGCNSRVIRHPGCMQAVEGRSALNFAITRTPHVRQDGTPGNCGGDLYCLETGEYGHALCIVNDNRDAGAH